MNSIPYSSLFYTPKDLEELDRMIRQLPAKDQSLVYQFTMYTFNLANKLVTSDNSLNPLEKQSS